MAGMKNILLALAPIIAFVTGVPAPGIGPHFNYVSRSYIVQFKEDVDVAAHAQWARSVHTRNLSKYSKRAPPDGLDGVKTIFRQFKYVLFPGRIRPGILKSIRGNHSEARWHGSDSMQRVYRRV